MISRTLPERQIGAIDVPELSLKFREDQILCKQRRNLPTRSREYITWSLLTTEHVIPRKAGNLRHRLRRSKDCRDLANFKVKMGGGILANTGDRPCPAVPTTRLRILVEKPNRSVDIRICALGEDLGE